MNLTTESLSHENIKILKILDLVCQLNRATKDDWFFEFSGHVKTVSVHYSKMIKKKCESCNSEKKEESIWLSFGTSIELQTGLNDLITELETHLENAND